MTELRCMTKGEGVTSVTMDDGEMFYERRVNNRVC